MPVAAPLVTTGISAIGGWLGSRKSKDEKQYSAAMQSSMANLGALGKQASAFGREQYALGGPATAQAMNYYTALLHGDRAKQSQAVAAPAAAITDVYRGAQRGLDRSMVRGGSRDLATAELNRDRAGKLASLVTGVQPQAAASLAEMGDSAYRRAGGFMGLASGAYGNQGEIASGANQQATQRKQYTNELWTGVGRDIFNVWKPHLFDENGSFRNPFKRLPAGGYSDPGF